MKELRKLMVRWELTMFVLAPLLTQAQSTMLLRQPTLHGDQVVFVYANDLWKASVQGGQAMRLTSDEGYESNPHFSADGRWIAFTAEYDGNSDVYVIPAQGGEPKRLTWHPGMDEVQGWTPDGQVVFRSSRAARPTRLNQLYVVPLEGGLPRSLGLERAAYGEVSPDGRRVAYIPITFWDPEFRNYRGGQAMPVWITDLKTLELKRTPQPTAERHLDPVWHNQRVCYISERDFTANIWSFDPDSGAEKQLTFHKKFDVKSLDSDGQNLVYEQGGYLHLLNPTSGNTRRLDITVRGDMNFSRTRWEEAPTRQLSNPVLSPTGQRALFEYRGEIFSVPANKGSWRNLSSSPGVADRYPAWSPKGDRIAWFSDQDGEYGLVIADQDGSIQKQIHLKDPSFYFRPEWSPDGRFLAYTDTDYQLWITDVDSGDSWVASTERYAHPERSMNPVWSPDSQWIAYARQLTSHFKAIFATNVKTRKTVQLTDGMADAISPVWDVSGNYLYFLASTNYGLSSGWLDMSSYDFRTTRGLYALVLAADGKAPSLPASDEEPGPAAAVADSKKSTPKDDPINNKTVSVRIDEDGIFDRALPMDLPQRNYTGLAPGPEGQVFVWENIPNETGLKVLRFDVSKQKSEDFGQSVNQMAVSHDRKSALVQAGGNWSIAKTAEDLKKAESLKLDIRVLVDPRAEYRQIFREGWRFMRDFLYVDNTHGAPWDDIYNWYAPWIDHVRHRTDLNYVVDIMSGEISVGHSYVSGGDFPDIDRVPVGLLGCDFAVEQGHIRITRIYSGERWNPSATGPLAAPGIDVHVGDYLLEIEGQPLSASTNPFALLEQRAGRPTRLTVNSTPNLNGSRQVLVEPVASENNLRTMEWVESNRRRVDELSGGKLAYVYVPNTGRGGFESFNRYYFAQQDKQGVVIDERNNGGGSAADYIIDILTREPMGYFNSKVGDRRPWTTPMAGIWGPKVMLINERSGSGGDLLPYMFRLKKLGPLVGTRTWGGLVGTWDTPRFVDGGRMVAPRGGFFDLNGNWAVEDQGVAPDIEVIDHPRELAAGRDPQLERAVEEAMKLLGQQTFFLQKEPSPPKKWRRAAGYENED